MASLKAICQNWHSSKTNYIKFGGSVTTAKEICRQQLITHYRLLGSESMNTFPILFKTLTELKHSSCGFYEYERNPNVTGVLSWEMNHSSWVLDSKRCNLTEKTLMANFGNEIDSNLMPSLTSTIVFGGGIKAAMAEKRILNFLGIPGLKEARDFLEDSWELILQKKLSFKMSVVSKLLKGLITEKMIRNKPSNFWKLPILISSSTILTARLKNKLGTLTVRGMTLPTLAELIKERSMQRKAQMDSLNPVVGGAPVEDTSFLRGPLPVEKESAKFEAYWSSIKKIRMYGITSFNPPAGLPASKTTATSVLIDLPTDVSSVVLKKWKNIEMDTVEEEIWDMVKQHVSWLDVTVEKTMANSNFFMTKSSLAQFISDGITRQISVQSRSGTGRSGYVDAVEKVVQMQGSMRGQTELQGLEMREGRTDPNLKYVELLSESILNGEGINLAELKRLSEMKPSSPADDMIRYLLTKEIDPFSQGAGQNGISWSQVESARGGFNTNIKHYKDRRGNCSVVNRAGKTEIFCSSHDPGLLKKAVAMTLKKGWWQPKNLDGFGIDQRGHLIKGGIGVPLFDSKLIQPPVMRSAEVSFGVNKTMTILFRSRDEQEWCYVALPGSNRLLERLSKVLKENSGKFGFSKMVVDSVVTGKRLDMEALSKAVTTNISDGRREIVTKLLRDTSTWYRKIRKKREPKSWRENEEETMMMIQELLESAKQSTRMKQTTEEVSEERFGRVDQVAQEDEIVDNEVDSEEDELDFTSHELTAGEDDFRSASDDEGDPDFTNLSLARIATKTNGFRSEPINYSSIGDEGSLVRAIYKMLEEGASDLHYRNTERDYSI